MLPGLFIFTKISISYIYLDMVEYDPSIYRKLFKKIGSTQVGNKQISNTHPSPGNIDTSSVFSSYKQEAKTLSSYLPLEIIAHAKIQKSTDCRRQTRHSTFSCL
ncbi:hypothetical protein V6Z11_D04G055700 [Gossypium hirsutum]